MIPNGLLDRSYNYPKLGEKDNNVNVNVNEI